MTLVACSSSQGLCPSGQKELAVRRGTLQRLERFFAILGFAALLGVVGLGAVALGLEPNWDAAVPRALRPPAWGTQIALVSGHAGFDSGAICTAADGTVTLREVDINASVTERVAEHLRSAGATVLVLEEYDPRLAALEVDVLLSLHADSCIEASGYKAAGYVRSTTADADAALLACIDQHYAEVTGLPHHPNTVTHDMTEYHAFRRIAPTTPAAILELGFLGGDQTILTEQPDLIARGVAESLLCFLLPPTQAPPD
jgi:N-acetylmuramoyl-L-alanine amidase